MHKVSVILPVYNCERFLKHSIESVRRQTYSDWELIIVDDGSTDNSLSEAKQEPVIFCKLLFSSWK